MKSRKLGRSGLKVSALGLGGLSIGGKWSQLGEIIRFGETDDKESIRAIQRAMDHGINFFDTAANYGAGHSEKILGRAIGERRNEIVISTKFGYQVNEETSSVRYYDDDINSDKVAKNIRKDCEASLRRLNTDYIDLYMFHVNRYSPTKAVEVRDTLEELVSEGLIRFYGWSTDNTEGARVFAEGKHCVAIQHVLNVMNDSAEMLKVCDIYDQASVNRDPLGKGLLTGKYTFDTKFLEYDYRGSVNFRDEYMGPILGKLDSIRGVLMSDGRTMAQGALAWIWARSKRTIPVPGFRTVQQVEENINALEYGPLTDAQMHHIDEILRSEQRSDE